MIYFVTTNIGKFSEVREKLGLIDLEVEMLNTPYPEVQGDSLREVVLFALESLRELNKRLLIDDSGLFIQSLNGFPGVYSSYIFKTLGCNGILKLLENERNRKAWFECNIGYLVPGSRPKIFEGRVNGNISTTKKGEHGFGYDPIFVPSGHTRTFGEMNTSEKNKISHRGKALQKLMDFLMHEDR